MERRFRMFAWSVLAYTVFVILWGAYVRATGSGAGCGAHWPLCNGEVIPRVGSEKTLVELGHRVTSGVAWVLALVLAVWARRASGPGAPVRRAAAWSFVLMTTEALIGASIVLLEKVADDASIARGGWMVAHLLNTFLLLAALAMTAWYASSPRRPRLRVRGPAGWVAVAAASGALLLGASGAITALGDTLFPETSFEAGLSPAAHVFLQLRVLHPLIALVVGLLVLLGAGYLAGKRPSRTVRVLAISVAALYVAQIGLGFLNVALMAPVWLQLVHLLFADLVWLAIVLLGASALDATAAATAPARRPSGDLDVVEGEASRG
jgi:heme A synthase